MKLIDKNNNSKQKPFLLNQLINAVVSFLIEYGAFLVKYCLSSCFFLNEKRFFTKIEFSKLMNTEKYGYSEEEYFSCPSFNFFYRVRLGCGADKSNQCNLELKV